MVAGLLSAVRFGSMSDKDKIEKIFEYTRVMTKGVDGKVKKCKFIRKDTFHNGTEYVYRLPLGFPYKQIEHLNQNVGVFKDGLHKDVELEFDGGMLHVFVYETSLPKKWLYREMIPELKEGQWSIPIGKTYKGLVWHDFDKIPHTVIGGTTRYGKTVGLKSMMTSLILSNPNGVEFYVIDLKEKLEFGKYEKLEQVKKVAGNPEEALEMLEDLCERIIDVMHHFRDNDITNITETGINNRIFVIVDEANRLVPENDKDKQRKRIKRLLEFIASVAGGLGVRLIFCTQYPVGSTLPRDIKQNSDAKISFRLQSGKASEVVLGEGNTQAASLPDIPGRCMCIQGPNMFEMQVPLISDRVMNHYLQNWYRTKRKEVGEDEEREDIIKTKHIGDA